mmetsp:Transcript_2003/g.5130  ORF Transcript_2003/g.5130 Transcript_2003/m.5130 type:complete len:227 (-) Transcript_2003:138-818(-)
MRTAAPRPSSRPNLGLTESSSTSRTSAAVSRTRRRTAACIAICWRSSFIRRTRCSQRTARSSSRSSAASRTSRGVSRASRRAPGCLACTALHRSIPACSRGTSTVARSERRSVRGCLNPMWTCSRTRPSRALSFSCTRGNLRRTPSMAKSRPLRVPGLVVIAKTVLAACTPTMSKLGRPLFAPPFAPAAQSRVATRAVRSRSACFALGPGPMSAQLNRAVALVWAR